MPVAVPLFLTLTGVVLGLGMMGWGAALVMSSDFYHSQMHVSINNQYTGTSTTRETDEVRSNRGMLGAGIGLVLTIGFGVFLPGWSWWQKTLLLFLGPVMVFAIGAWWGQTFCQKSGWKQYTKRRDAQKQKAQNALEQAKSELLMKIVMQMGGEPVFEKYAELPKKSTDEIGKLLEVLLRPSSTANFKQAALEQIIGILTGSRVPGKDF